MSDNIIPVLSSVEKFEITPKTYDLIIASSVVEHSVDKSEFNSVINNIKNGTKLGGINRLSITVDLTETELESDKELPPLIGTNLALDEAIELFKEAYSEWKIIDQAITPYEEVQDRNGVKIIWSCNYFSLIAQKIKY